MRLTSADALATRHAPNRNPSADLALVGCSASLDGAIVDSVAALLSLPQARALLSQGRLEVPPIPIRAHPATWALNPRQFARTQLQELVRFARAPLDANPVVPGLHRTDTPHAPLRTATATGPA